MEQLVLSGLYLLTYSSKDKGGGTKWIDCEEDQMLPARSARTKELGVKGGQGLPFFRLF